MPPKKTTSAVAKGASISVAGGGGGEPAVFSRPQCTIHIHRGNEVFGKLVFELAVDVLPRTTENFKQLSQGVTVGDKKAPKTATYKGCRFLRLTEEGLQTGDALHREDGKGNDSIYGPAFDDEQFGVYPHKWGVLSMCNSGPNTNGSQFFICLHNGDACGFLDSRHVSFGKLVDGDDVLGDLVRELKPHVVENSAGKIDASAPFVIGSIIMNAGGEGLSPPPLGK